VPAAWKVKLLCISYIGALTHRATRRRGGATQAVGEKQLRPLCARRARVFTGPHSSFPSSLSCQPHPPASGSPPAPPLLLVVLQDSLARLREVMRAVELSLRHMRAPRHPLALLAERVLSLTAGKAAAVAGAVGLWQLLAVGAAAVGIYLTVIAPSLERAP
jgi:hypothetical protein